MAWRLAPGDDADASTADGAQAGPQGGTDLLTLAWLAGSLDNLADRRAVLRLGATLATAPLLGVEESMNRLACALTSPMALQEDTVTFLGQRTIGLYRIEAEYPARLVHRAIVSHLREVTALLEGHVGDLLWAQLARIAGESAVLAGWTAWDLGEAAHSARMYRITETAARAASDQAIMACAHTYRSYSTSGTTAHETARAMLAEARKCLPETGEHATRAWVLGREAEEAAAIGDPAAKSLVKQAAEAYGQAQPQRERPWTKFLDETRMSALELSTYTPTPETLGVGGRLGCFVRLVPWLSLSPFSVAGGWAGAWLVPACRGGGLRAVPRSAAPAGGAVPPFLVAVVLAVGYG